MLFNVPYGKLSAIVLLHVLGNGWMLARPAISYQIVNPIVYAMPVSHLITRLCMLGFINS